MSDYSDDPFWKAEQYDAGSPRFKQQIDGLSDELSQAKKCITNLKEQIEAAHRVIDTFGLSRCGDSHATISANGARTCGDGKPPLSLAERVQWLIDMMPDDQSEQVATLRAVVEQVEWIEVRHGHDKWLECAYCHWGNVIGRHAHNCSRQVALGLKGGE